jgi:hypothetical protein
MKRLIFRVQDLDHCASVAGICDRIGLVEQIDRSIADGYSRDHRLSNLTQSAEVPAILKDTQDLLVNLDKKRRSTQLDRLFLLNIILSERARVYLHCF